MKTRKRRVGFTLIEIMITIAIIAILAAILLPSFVRARHKAYHAGCLENMKSIRTAMESYQVDNFTYPTTLSQLANGKGYLNIISDCPSIPGVQYGAAYYELDPLQQKFYTLSCHGLHYLQLNGTVRQGFPQITPQGQLNTN